MADKGYADFRPLFAACYSLLKECKDIVISEFETSHGFDEPAATLLSKIEDVLRELNKAANGYTA